MLFDTIPARNLYKYSDRSKYSIIDVRAASEYMRGHVPGAVNIPQDIFEKEMRTLTRTKKYVLYCDRGTVSLLMARKMFREGYDVLSVIGGLHAYTGDLIAGRR